MIKRIKPDNRIELILDNFGHNRNLIARFLIFHTTEKYSRKEREMIYYLIKLFLDNKKCEIGRAHV